jgi:muramoyltetrapeptide carboxypeptidase LdcA involved in peptidoglycan recycling
MHPIKAKALRRGDVISVIAPAGPVVRERIERALDRLRAFGYRIKTHGDIFRSRGYLAGDDETRALEIMAAFVDPESTAVWCARGGYGVVRLLERLDFDVIRRHPKVFVGFSDITALHLAIQNRTGLITFHGPNLQDGFGTEDGMSATTEDGRGVGGGDGGRAGVHACGVRSPCALARRCQGTTHGRQLVGTLRPRGHAV